MSIDVTEFARADGESFKFEKVGDKITGTVTHLTDPFERENKFKQGEMQTVFCIGITPDDGGEQQLVWPVIAVNGQRKPDTKAQAIADAVITAGAKQLEEGGRLAIQYSGDKDTGKGNPLKLYTAQYKQPTGGVSVDDLLG